MAAVFGTQQRYLMAQIGLAMVFESESNSFLLTRVIDMISSHGVASRNTAESFIREMQHYGLVFPAPPLPGDKRSRPLAVAQECIDGLRGWLMVHLRSLDTLDGGGRLGMLMADPGLLARVHPVIVRLILNSQQSTGPEGTFALFTWMNDGGLLMEKMLGNIDNELPVDGRVMTSITSFQELSEPLRISRTHLARKLSFSESEGHLGWVGKRGASTFWLSTQFVREYDTYQADKIARIEQGFQAVVGAAKG